MSERLIRTCFYCGPRTVYSKRSYDTSSIVCPTCGLDPGEIRSIEEVRSKGFEQAYRDECARDKVRAERESAPDNPRGLGRGE